MCGRKLDAVSVLGWIATTRDAFADCASSVHQNAPNSARDLEDDLKVMGPRDWAKARGSCS